MHLTPEDQARLQACLDAFPGARVLLIGDFLLDRWVHGTIQRISREAPVFVVEYEDEYRTPGGAAHAAVQFQVLDAQVRVLGWLGDDPAGRELLHQLQKHGIQTDGLVWLSDRETIVKTRYIAGSPYSVKQQILRVDRGRSAGSGDPLYREWQRRYRSFLSETDLVVISDYGYGAVQPEWTAQVIQTARSRGIPVVGDSRYHLDHFCGATAVTPNEPELSEALRLKFTGLDDLVPAAQHARDAWHLDAVLVTRGSNGMLLVTSDTVLPLDVFGPPAPVDVTGAGDTVLAVFGLALLRADDYALAAKLANIAGGLAVMRKGAFPVPRTLLRRAVETGGPV